DPATSGSDSLQTAAEQAAQDVQVVRAATYGTGVPSGSGWMQVTTTYVRRVDDRIEQYFQVASVTDPSPDAPSVPSPKPVTISPNSSGSWRNGRPDDYVDYPMQGDWTGGGNRRGGWFYGTKIAD